MSKKKFIFGTDFNMAKDNRYSTEWWKENKDITFVIPHIQRSGFLNCINSKTEIKKGFVYPYCGSRGSALIPEEFELNRENGVFIGIYLDVPP